MQYSVQAAALLESTSLLDSIKRGVRFGLAWATCGALVASGLLLGLLIACVVLAHFKGDPLDKAGEAASKLVAYLVTVYAFVCAVGVVCGVAFSEYVRLVVRRP